jgi:transposase
MSSKFIEIGKPRQIIINPDFEGWVEPDDLARFVVEIIDQLDLTAFENKYSNTGSEAYHPRMMLALLFYCYISGIFSSRKISRSTYQLIPVIFITNGLHPHHTVIADFRKKFLKELEDVFIQVVQIAVEMGVSKLGDVTLDGTKVKANASKHKALSYEYACKLEIQIKKEIATLMKKSEEADTSSINNIDIPDELKRREDRLKLIESTKAEIESRRKIRYEIEKAEYDKKIEVREQKELAKGHKLGGVKPKVPTESPSPSDQVNFTDPESRIMPKSGGGFEQSYNAQASVDADSMLILGNHVSQNPNDKKELEPALDELDKLPDCVGKIDKVAADNGYKSDGNLELADERNVEIYVPSGRQKHNQKLDDMLSTKEEPIPPKNPTLSEALEYRMATKSGKAFYAIRKSTIEPVFGIIKEVMGFRKFSLRGIESVTGEWNLVCIAYNIKRLRALNLKKA